MPAATLSPPPTLYPQILRPDRNFCWLLVIYAVAISALSLSLPLSVQVLVSTVVNSALLNQVIVLALILFLLLLLSSFFMAIQTYLMELFERRFYARVVTEVSLRLVHAQPAWMSEISGDELLNRYFDVMTVQKSLPPLIAGSLALSLQALVGVAVTSFYHPVFLIFNITVALVAWAIFRLFDRGAEVTAIRLSDAKYETARWLQDLARSNAFFKGQRTSEYALAHTLDVRDDYIAAHRRHFRFTFTQIAGMLTLYALASGALLGIGGWLVIVGQLTIGQLVAAELIFSAIFYGLTRLGYYLELYYDTYAAFSKLNQLLNIEQENYRHEDVIDDWAPEISFEHVTTTSSHRKFNIDMQFAAGSKTMLETRSNAQIKAMTDLLLGVTRPSQGRVQIGGHDIDDFALPRLRDDIHVIDAANLPELSIASLFRVAAPEMTRASMRSLLDIVGLGSDLTDISEKLDQRLSHTGYPLTTVGVIKLKIAFALAARPRILVLTPLFDMLSREARASVMQHLRAQTDITVLCFSHRQDLSDFDNYVMCDFDRQTTFASIEALMSALDSATDSTDIDEGSS